MTPQRKRCVPKDWHEHRDELTPGQVFKTAHGFVQLERRTPGDGTQWTVASWWGSSWAYTDDRVEPSELLELMPEGYVPPCG